MEANKKVIDVTNDDGGNDETTKKDYVIASQEQISGTSFLETIIIAECFHKSLID